MYINCITVHSYLCFRDLIKRALGSGGLEDVVRGEDARRRLRHGLGPLGRGLRPRVLAATARQGCNVLAK